MQNPAPIIHHLKGLSNREFLDRYAGPGRIGLSGGVTWVDRAISRAQRHLDEGGTWSLWSHAFLFQGRRADGQHWLIESDLQAHHKHIQFGVQENRLDKYYDEKLYTRLAVLDFGLSEPQVTDLLTEALALVANRARYSLRELVGTLIALRHPRLRSRNNLLARERCMYCSAFVQHVFRQAKIDLAPGIDLKNTTPEHIARTLVPHRAYMLDRVPAPGKLEGLRQRVRGKIRSRMKRLAAVPNQVAGSAAASPSPSEVARSAASRVA